jgi:hypothetical protein
MLVESEVFTSTDAEIRLSIRVRADFEEPASATAANSQVDVFRSLRSCAPARLTIDAGELVP